MPIHEVDFCGVVSSAINTLVHDNPGSFPFATTRVEGWGRGARARDCKDLRFLDDDGQIVLCGEVKLPGARGGRSAFDNQLMQDAFQKAENAGVRYFFTWTVNEFVLFDRSRWQQSLIDRRVRHWRLERNLASRAPDTLGGHRKIALLELDAIVGNPPYVRQEKIDKPEKDRFGELVSTYWPDLRLSGRSDLHCYFWPVAARLLRPNGYFGFLTSSSWLDVEYGFALQGWVLRNFRILAVMESAAEPWFTDARVKTCITILQRCDDEASRMANLVRFVRFDRRLADIIGVATGEDEVARQAAVVALRERILSTVSDWHDSNMRIIVKRQGELWADGVRAGSILASSPTAVDVVGIEEEEPTDDDPDEPDSSSQADIFGNQQQDYRAGKWGRYLRAPDIYFEIMSRFGNRLIALGGIAQIRFGVKTGCDAFFMPKDVTATMIERHRTDADFRQNTNGAPRRDAAAGRLKIVEAGDGSVHPIEARYLRPEVHSPMEVDRPVVRAPELDRVVLLVAEPMDELRSRARWVHAYLRYGRTATFPSKKSKPVPVPQRSTCTAREPWYDLTGLVRPGIAFWPMAQQYRHIIAANPDRLICNHNLFDVAPLRLSPTESSALVCILNSTLVGLFKTFYGRFAGTEGNLKTEVVDVNLLEVPDPRGVSAEMADRLTAALDRMSRRDVGRLVEEQLMDCHTPERARHIASGPLVLSQELRQADRRDLDDAVFELLGVTDSRERSELIDRLYAATARHFRDIRVVEIEKMQQRAKSDSRRFNTHDLAADIWDAAQLTDTAPLAEWLARHWPSQHSVDVPEDRPATVSDEVMFAPNTVYFGRSRSIHIDCCSTDEARLVARLANLGINGTVRVPAVAERCARMLTAVNDRIDDVRLRFKELAESRTGNERVQSDLVALLQEWFVHGREPIGDASRIGAAEPALSPEGR